MALSENQVVIPALLAMVNNGGEIKTEELIDIVARDIVLDNNDMAPLINRNDERYTQIVRNLKSHDRLSKKGLAVHIEGGFKITNKGIDWLIDGGFLPEDRR